MFRHIEDSRPGVPWPSSHVGRYQLIRRIAIGGMAELFLARASGLEGFSKLVVLKRILPQHAADEDFVRMFLDEARLAAMLHHPNIAQVYDIGRDGEHYFFTMEFVHGEDMRTITRAGASAAVSLPLAQAVTVIANAAAALHHAHEAAGADGRPLGIVHRDVSPANILVGYDGTVKLVDFGIAKAATHHSSTRAGTLKGKIAYMSPEQCGGEPLDRRSDIFSLGILLFEFTTGRHLFRGENDLALLKQIAERDVVPPSRLVPDYPRELERIVVRALRRDRDQRYHTAQDVQLDLEEFARESKLSLSSVALARHMERLFGAKLTPWRAAQKSGISLAQFMTDSTEADPLALRALGEVPTAPTLPDRGVHPDDDGLTSQRTTPAVRVRQPATAEVPDAAAARAAARPADPGSDAPLLPAPPLPAPRRRTASLVVGAAAVAAVAAVGLVVVLAGRRGPAHAAAIDAGAPHAAVAPEAAGAPASAPTPAPGGAASAPAPGVAGAAPGSAPAAATSGPAATPPAPRAADAPRRASGARKAGARPVAPRKSRRPTKSWDPDSVFLP